MARGVGRRRPNKANYAKRLIIKSAIAENPGLSAYRIGKLTGFATGTIESLLSFESQLDNRFMYSEDARGGLYVFEPMGLVFDQGGNL